MSIANDAPLSALMGPGAFYEGDLSFEGRVRVDGHFRGRVYTEDLLEVGPAGLVEGAADVARAVVWGKVEGILRVRERLVIHGGGEVAGKLDAGILDLRPGARLSGDIRVAGKVLP